MKTLRLTVKGIVQRVGYRSLVEMAARRLKIKGYVKNLDDAEESVEIVIQHKDNRVLGDFLTKINLKTALIDVQQIIKQEISAEEFIKFEIIRGSYEDENAERLDVAAHYLDNLTAEVKTGNEKITDKLDDFHKDTDKRFDVMEHKYGKVSDELGEISKNLKELVDILKLFKPNP